MKNEQARTFAEITREKSIEYKPSYVEKIPETISLDQLRNDSIASLNGQYQPL